MRGDREQTAHLQTALLCKIRRVLQLLHEAGLSQREAARVAGVSKSCASDIASRARAAGLSWAQARELDDDALHARLHPAPVARSARHLEPDWSQGHQQLKRPGVTLQLLWEEWQREGYVKNSSLTAWRI